ESGRIRSMANANGYAGKLHIRGRVARSDVSGLMHENDILCMPSRAEALGVALMEGLASGISVIGSDVGGVPEVLDGGRAGWLVQPRNPCLLRKTILQVIRDEGERENKRVHGRDHVHRFGIQPMMAEFASVVGTVLNRSKAPIYGLPSSQPSMQRQYSREAWGASRTG
ncbi:MAG: glycosyltransferase family 4 protein, partial [Rhodothermia bacterium]|nr:glycosyltransferase family 4 protein [Rhodothermia bacterium]